MSDSSSVSANQRQVNNAAMQLIQQEQKKLLANPSTTGTSPTVNDLKNDVDKLLSKDGDKKDEKAAADQILGKVDPKATLSSNPLG